ncbi:Hypothetical protein CINCED_3A018135 [Cinara cedri]|uniref:Uncharacterized protein n=1 Tax=Cinara cedri TaxID=506608 RepID=A0A5E4MU65_9HEMI|nr:Hypothetical protein CINCED_3A018135 [Cinara cedri]
MRVNNNPHSDTKTPSMERSPSLFMIPSEIRVMPIAGINHFGSQGELNPNKSCSENRIKGIESMTVKPGGTGINDNGKAKIMIKIAKPRSCRAVLISKRVTLSASELTTSFKISEADVLLLLLFDTQNP